MPMKDGNNIEWYRPGPLIREFHASPARVRVLIGGRGSGKTTAVAVEILRHCWFNAGARVYVLRKTTASNVDTTLETFEYVLSRCGPHFVETATSLFKKQEGGRVFRLPSCRAVEAYQEYLKSNPRASKVDRVTWLDTVGSRLCGYVVFSGVPEERYRASRFRGFECSLLVFVEADQLTEEDFELGLACLRWKGSDPETVDDRGFIRDSGVILDTNPPGTKHWIAKLEERTTNDLNFQFWHIPTRDNAANLPAGYIELLERQYASNPAMYQRMLEGKYADAFEGSPVLFAFRPGHVYEHLPWPKGAYLIRGWDFGTHNAVVISAYWEQDGDEYWADLYEIVQHDSDTERQCRAVWDVMRRVFPFWNDRSIVSGVRDFCDIAGASKTDLGSSIEVLRTYGFFPGYSRIRLQESLALYNRLLEKRDKKGRLVYMLDKAACPSLYLASAGGYRYPQEGEPGYGSDEPLKGRYCDHLDHVVDASRYAKWHMLRLRPALSEVTKPSVGPLKRRYDVNPYKDF